jgi:hypothetical protein
MTGMLGRVDLTCRYMYITKNRRSYKYEYDDPPREEGTEEGLVFGRVLSLHRMSITPASASNEGGEDTAAALQGVDIHIEDHCGSRDNIDVPAWAGYLPAGAPDDGDDDDDAGDGYYEDDHDDFTTSLVIFVCSLVGLLAVGEAVCFSALRGGSHIADVRLFIITRLGTIKPLWSKRV